MQLDQPGQRYELAERRQVRISVQSGTPEAFEFNTFLELRDESCSSLAFNDNCDHLEFHHSCLTVELEPGMYSIAVSDTFGGELGSYELSVDCVDLSLCRDCLVGEVDCDESISADYPRSGCKLTGELGIATARDLYRLRLQEAGPVAIDLSSSSFDTVLHVYDAACREIARNDHCSVVSLNSCIRLEELEAGEYFIGVSSLVDGESGTYELGVHCSRFGPCEECVAAPLDCGETTTGALTGEDCRLESGRFFDRCPLHLEEGGQVDIHLSSPSFDTFLFLEDARCLIRGGVFVDLNGGCGPDSLSSCLSEALPPGDYSIIATSSEPGVTGAYALSVLCSREVSICDDCSAGEIPCNGSVRGDLALSACSRPAGFFDTYRLEIPEPATVELEVAGDTELWRVGARLFLFDQACLPVALNDDCSFTESPCRLQLDLEAGTYFAGMNFRARIVRARYTLSARCEFPGSGPPARFLRGDADGSGGLALLDATMGLRYLFASQRPAVACVKALDFDDSGALGLDDMVALLVRTFANGADPPEPFSDCGPDPTEDDLPCEQSAPSCPHGND